MPVSLIEVKGSRVKIELTVELSRSMLDTEERIQEALNEAGCIASREALGYFDPDGSPIQIGPEIWRTKGQQPKCYPTPYGEGEVARHVYQRSGGGATYGPLERDARIVITSTPRLAKPVSSQLAQGVAREVQRDLAENHARPVAVSYLQRLGEAIGTVVQVQEAEWEYALPTLDATVASVAVGLDGTGLLMGEDGWRQAMVGTLALFDAAGERLHTLYVAATPEYGKATFLGRLERELARVKAAYPEVTYLGLAAGAEDNWRFLTPHTAVQRVDFSHASSSLQAVAGAAFPRAEDQKQRATWRTDACHRLKHEPDAAQALLQEMKRLPTAELNALQRQQLQSAMTYFYYHHHQMNYAAALEHHWPIGSGVTEAACKTVVKQRLCRSGMRWKEKGAAVVLSLRALMLTPDRWRQFWEKLDQFGFPVAV